MAMALHAVFLLAFTLTSWNAGVSAEEPCVPVSSEDFTCQVWRYPSPNLCISYIQCQANCQAKVHFCARIPGMPGQRYHFSNATQNCELPSIANCTDDTPPTTPTSPVTVTVPTDHTITPPTVTPTVTGAFTIQTTVGASTPPPIPLTPTVFCALRKSDIGGASEPVNFDELTVNEGGAFNLSYDVFTPKASGLYWFHFSVGLPEITVTDVTIVGLKTTGRTPSVRRGSGGAEDTTSRNEITPLTVGVDTLHLATINRITSDAIGVDTSWSGFHLESVMTSVAAFSVGLSYSLWEDMKIPFDLIHVDTHSTWNSSQREYSFPVAGTWVISLTCGDQPSFAGRGFTYLNVTRYRLMEVAHQWSKDGVDIDGMTVIVGVTTRDKVSARLGYNPVYGDRNYPTSLMGFLYSPINLPAVSFFVSVIEDFEGLQDPLAFPWIITNDGNGWNDLTNTFKPPVDGVYYLTWTAYTAYNSYSARLDLMVNRIDTASVNCPNMDGNRSRTRAIILRLTTTDEIWIRLVENTYVGGSMTEVMTMFAGFRLSA